MEKVTYAISACLLGEACRYDGKDNLAEELRSWASDKEYILICPEVMGGMTTPRAPSEIKGDRVIDSTGQDVSEYFTKGSNVAMQKMEEAGATIAILKSKSPSCGVGQIYDGNFSSTLIDGNGVFVEEALKRGIQCYSFEEFYSKIIKRK